MAMSYMTRDDIPYHYALADAFTVGDAYHCSIMGPTNPNRCYLWTGCIGNVNYLGSGGTDGLGAGPVTYNGLSVNNAYFVWETFPEVLQAAGVSWKIYQDLAGATFAPDFGDGTGNSFAGNFTDNSMLYFNQYATAAPGTPLFDNAATGTEIINTIPSASAPAQAWQAWAEHLFDEFRSDVKGGKLPQVSWIVAPAGYTEHSDWPINYGAWYISQIFDILVSNPEVFSKTVFIVNYDEADGSFDHIVPPTPPQTPAYGASTVSIENEIVTTSTPNGPIGLGTRVPFLAISPWSKGGYVNSQVFDHTSVIQFIEKRFGVFERNISPWRRAVAGDLTSVFNFANPNDAHASLPGTSGYLPPVAELAGGNVNTFMPTLSERDPRRAGAGKRYPPGACLALRVGCSRIGQCFEQHGRPDVLQHGPRDCGVSGAFRQPRGCGALLHGGTRQDAGWYVERCLVLSAVGLRPQWLRALFQWQHRLRRRGSRCSRPAMAATTMAAQSN